MMNGQSENLLLGSMEGLLNSFDFLSLASPEEKLKFQITLELISQAHPGKIYFSIKEASEKLEVGEEFIRRRVKSGSIRVDYLGDKPKVHITELARISMKGIN